jgi:hypothetical protein
MWNLTDLLSASIQMRSACPPKLNLGLSGLCHELNYANAVPIDCSLILQPGTF